MTVTKPKINKTCPVCNSTSRKLFDVNQYIIRSCHVCAHQFTEKIPSSHHVDDVFDDAYFKGKEYPDYLSEAKYLKLKGRKYAQLIRRFIKKPGRLLDVGTAAGCILQGFIDRDWNGSGIEPNSQMVDHAAESGLRVTQATLEAFRTREKYDLVLMIQVIAHLTDLQSAFQNAAEATQSGGLWLIETGDRDSLSARISGEKWAAYHPPSTLHWFSRKDLQRLVAQYGFQEIAHGRPLRWVNAGHAKFMLRRRQKGSFRTVIALALLLLIPDNFPLPVRANDQFWAIYKKLW
jgi:2-polyprenyl-3-methyl-5-hydroxy-6-metoxy-1,4-benzoquinol methylase